MKYIAVLIFSLLLSVCSSAKIKEEPFTVDFDSPKIPAGVLETHLDGFLNIGSLRKVDVTIEYFPREDAVCLQYRIDFMTYYQYWSKEGRAEYLRALEQYKEDYTLRNLSPKGSRKTKRQYGRVEAYLIWQAASYTVRAKANTWVELGYDIKNVSNNRASFFTLYQKEAVFENEMAKNERRGTKNMLIYLTRAQADELAAFFDQDFLKGLAGGKIGSPAVNTELDRY
jgi:hypothetical protein